MIPYMQFFSSFVFLFFIGCRHESPNFIYMPDMVYSPAIKAQQKESALRLPVSGTVPQDFYAYPYRDQSLSRALKNPLRPTSSVLTRGKSVYQVYCMVCHGPLGEGDGSVVPKFPRPPSLQSEKVRKWEDGMIYHEITMGMGLMPSYASQIVPADRWAVVHYVRVLQRSLHPTSEDIQKEGLR